MSFICNPHHEQHTMHCLAIQNFHNETKKRKKQKQKENIIYVIYCIAHTKYKILYIYLNRKNTTRRRRLRKTMKTHWNHSPNYHNYMSQKTKQFDVFPFTNTSNQGTPFNQNTFQNLSSLSASLWWDFKPSTLCECPILQHFKVAFPRWVFRFAAFLKSSALSQCSILRVF